MASAEYAILSMFFMMIPFYLLWLSRRLTFQSALEISRLHDESRRVRGFDNRILVQIALFMLAYPSRRSGAQRAVKDELM
jgi:hypothetical protein